MSRQEYNRIILSILEKIVEECPDLRFGQILVNSGALKGTTNSYGDFVILDPFYEEPKETLERIANNRSVEFVLNKENLNKLYEVN